MRRLALALLLIGPFAAAPAAAEQVDVFGRVLDLELPFGHCMLDYGQPVEAAMIDNMINVNQGANQLIAYFAPCGDLESFRAGQIDFLPVSGTLLVPMAGAGFQPSELDRAAFLAEMALQMPLLDDAQLAEIEGEINQRGSGASIGQSQFLGLLAQDANALYLGLLSDVTGTDGTTLPMVTLVALTQLADVPLSANLSREYVSNDDIALLLAELQPFMATLTGLNP